MAVWMKKKYVTGANYKVQKSPNGNGGKSNKKGNNNKKVKNQVLVGHKLLLVNMSNVDRFCPVTGKKLPKNGMVVEHNGTYYANYAASSRANS